MSTTLRIVIALILLMALFACVAATLTIVQVQGGSINAQLAAPTRTALFWQATNLQRYLNLRAISPNPHEPQDDPLKRYPFTWSTGDGLSIPDAPGSVADTLAKWLRYAVRPRPAADSVKVSLSEPKIASYGRLIDGELWTFAYQILFGEADTTATGTVLRTDALTDHYLQVWVDEYEDWDTGYRILRDKYSKYPYTILFVPRDADKPTLELFKNDKPITLHGQPIPEDKVAALFIEESVPLANLGRLRIESYGINDRMTQLIVDDMMTVMYVSWAVLAMGILVLIVFRGKRKQEQP